MVTFQRGYRIKKRNMKLKETINLIKEAVLANWNKKTQGKKGRWQNGDREVPSLFLMALIRPLPRPLSFDTNAQA